MYVRYVFVSVSLLAVSACHQEHKGPATPTAVKVMSLQQRSALVNSRYSASMEPATRVDLAFKVGGYVQSITRVKGSDGKTRLIQEGDRIAQGSELASLRRSDFSNRLAEARAAVAEAEVARDLAQLDFDRNDKLMNGNAIPKAQLDAVRTRLDAAKARVLGAKAREEEAATMLADSSVRAPFTGLLARRNLEVGALATPGVPVFTLTDISSVKVVLGVPDSVRDQLALGSTQSVSCDALPESAFTGKITRIGAVADPRSHVFEVEITLPNPEQKLRPGMVATVRLGLSSPTSAAAILPLSAVVRSRANHEHFAVFVVDEKSAPPVVHQQEVELGDFLGNVIPVRAGLPANSKVVVQGASMLSDGERIQIIP